MNSICIFIDSGFYSNGGGPQLNDFVEKPYQTQIIIQSSIHILYKYFDVSYNMSMGIVNYTQPGSPQSPDET